MVKNDLSREPKFNRSIVDTKPNVESLQTENVTARLSLERGVP